MDASLRVILQQLEAEKSIDRETLLEAIRSAIESAARKSMDGATNVTVDMDPDSLAYKVFEIRTVTEEVTDPTWEMSLDEARTLNPNAEVGNRLKVPTEPRNFGRIAAQTAKQVIMQKIRDAERDNIFGEFKQREGELVTGVVKRISHGNIIVSVGKTEGILPTREQSPRENFKPGDRVRAYLLEVERSPRGPQILLSRTSPELVRGLFELEVPEIYDETIEIRAIAREPGSRTKVAVHSNDGNVDAVGACVGMKGSRVRAVVEELCGEKIDIVRWSDDPAELCAHALNPADILDIQIDEDNQSILVTVPSDQLSLAIGKRGQNARLASRLIGWNIDISGEGDDELEEEEGEIAVEDLEGAESEEPVAAEEAESSETETPAESEDSAEAAATDSSDTEEELDTTDDSARDEDTPPAE